MASDQRFPAGTTVLLAGTKRGLFVLSSTDRQTWTIDEPLLKGHRVYHAVLDQRNGGSRLWATDNGDFYGTFLRYSDDLGATWQEPSRGIKFAEESGLALKNLWEIRPGRSDEPDTLYVGIDPANLWVSRDRGDTWDLNAGLANHPTREKWFPGAGGLCLHTISPDWSNKQRMFLAISAAGVMRTDDGGESWRFMNKGTRADFMPDKYPEFGQCVHRLIQHPTRPNVLYQQNHCGIYKSENAGEDWSEITPGLPSQFGFPIALDPNNPDTVYVIVEDEEARQNFGNQFVVYRSNDGGKEWQTLSEGLPSGSNVKLGVLRHGMCTDTVNPCGVYVGTNTGQLFASADRGDTWRQVADYMTAIFSLTVTTIA